MRRAPAAMFGIAAIGALGLVATIVGGGDRPAERDTADGAARPELSEERRSLSASSAARRTRGRSKPLPIGSCRSESSAASVAGLGSIVGRIVVLPRDSEAGTPVAGVTVDLFDRDPDGEVAYRRTISSPTATGKTGPDGEFELPTASYSSWTLIARNDRNTGLALRGNGPTDLGELKWRDSTFIGVSVASTIGEPLPHAYAIQLVSGIPLHRVELNTAGVVSIYSDWQALITAPGREIQVFEDTRDSNGTFEAGDFTVQLARGRDMDVQVVDGTGEPWTNAWVISGRPAVEERQTDIEGRLRLLGVTAESDVWLIAVGGEPDNRRVERHDVPPGRTAACVVLARNATD